MSFIYAYIFFFLLLNHKIIPFILILIMLRRACVNYLIAHHYAPIAIK